MPILSETRVHDSAVVIQKWWRSISQRKTPLSWEDDVEEEEDDNARVGFIQVRLIGPKPKNRAPKVQHKKDGDKNLRYSDCSPEIHAGLRKPGLKNGRSGDSLMQAWFSRRMKYKSLWRKM